MMDTYWQVLFLPKDHPLMELPTNAGHWCHHARGVSSRSRSCLVDPPVLNSKQSFLSVLDDWAGPWENVFYVIYEQQRRRSACASAQSDQHLCFSLLKLYNISRFYSRNFKNLAGFCGCAGRFVSGLVGNSRRHVLSCRGSIVYIANWDFNFGRIGLSLSPLTGQQYILIRILIITRKKKEKKKKKKNRNRLF